MTTYKPKSPWGKKINIRHGHASRRSCNAAEKAVETGVRQSARAEIDEGLEDYYEDLKESL
jgi:hypothetical protein